MDNNIKIFISYHNDTPIIQNEVFAPICAGSVDNCQKFKNKNILRDDDGVNISCKNDSYCELTVQYYVWKNLDKFENLNYVGFCHYRRFFNFTDKIYPTNTISGLIEYPFINDNIYDLFGMSKDTVTNAVSDFDVLTVLPTDLYNFNFKNTYEQYKKSKYHYIEDYDITLKILLEKYPEYKEAVNEYNKSRFAYFTNSFIMKTEIFKEYSEWLFSVLFEAEKYINNRKDAQSRRVMGYLGERLFGIYYTYLKLKKYKLKELQQVFVSSVDNKRYIPIVYTCNDNYAKQLYCSINSLKRNSDKNDALYIYILSSKTNLHFAAKHFLSKLSDCNCRINYISIDKNVFKNFPVVEVCKSIPEETYYKLKISSLLKMYDKILYIDCDTTVKSSLYDLYNTEISEYYAGGVEDVLADFSKERLGLKKYINAGVLLLNLKKMREDNIEEKFFKCVKDFGDKILWMDQDIFNIVLQDKILLLDKQWNAQVGEYPHCYKSGFNDIGKNAKIIHYIGIMKPWTKNNKSPFKFEYMKYERELPILFKLTKFSPRNFPKLIQNINETRKMLIKYGKTKKQLIIFDRYIIGKK